MKSSEKTHESCNDIAIVGMSCIVPGADNIKDYWQNIIGKVDAVTTPPPDWGGEQWYDPESSDNDRIYCQRAGYLGDLARFDPLKYGIMPNTVDGAEPEHFLALRIAHEALEDAGYPDIPLNKDQTEVILGRGTFVNRGYTALHQHGLVIEQTLTILKQLHPDYTEEQLSLIKQHLKKGLPPFDAQIAPGLVSTIMSGRVANRLDLKGTNYCLDAACSSSLVAVEQGVQDLLSNKCDTVIAGGVQLSTHQLILMVFCQLGALSKTSQIRPFDRKADGTLLGEGLGMVVLKRLADAKRDGNRIYAVIKAVASASDGRGKSVVAPRVEGEELAIKRAYEKAGLPQESIGLIEAHGTAMPVGDATEIEGLCRQFGFREKLVPHCAVGSVKSMIAHLIPASGIAALIKTALALYHKTLPPTLHCDEPNPDLGLEKTPFYINTETRPWITDNSHPRRAGVNAFGFGGINAHAILEEYVDPDQEPDQSFSRKWTTELCLFQAKTRTALIERCQRVLSFLQGNPSAGLIDIAYSLNLESGSDQYRLAVVASSIADLSKKLKFAITKLQDKEKNRIKVKKGIFFFENQIGRDGKIGFLYPGEGSQYVNMLSDLCLHFPEVRTCFDSLDQALTDLDLAARPSQIIFPPPSLGKDERLVLEDKLWDMEYAVDSVITADRALTTLLGKLGIQPDAVVGHSSGEFMALEAAGTLQINSEEERRHHIKTGHIMIQQLAAAENIQKAQLVAMGPVDRSAVDQLLEKYPDTVYLAMDNCPHQVILCAGQETMDTISEEFRGSGTICQPLPFKRPYHTPLYAPACAPLAEFYETLPMQIPHTSVYSCMSAEVMPTDKKDIRRLAIGQWAAPVRFRETVEAMHRDGVSIFLEVGPKANLSGFVNDTLKGQDILAVPLNVHYRDGITQMHHALGMLAAHGVTMDLAYLYQRRSPQKIDFSLSCEEVPQLAPKLSLNLPLLSLEGADLDLLRPPVSKQAMAVKDVPGGSVAASPPERSGAPTSQAMVSYLKTMEQFIESQQEIMQAYFQGNSSAPAVSDRLGRKNQSQQKTKSDTPPQNNTENIIDRSVHHSNAEENSLKSDFGDSPASKNTKELLLEVVSEKTGYPHEMLNLDLNLEADLGIDSIKRVEILGSFSAKAGLNKADTAKLNDCKNLQQILDNIGSGDEKDRRSPSYPFIRDIVTHDPGRLLHARCVLDLSEDLFLFDHTLGRNLSVSDPQLQGLPLMPLTMSMEMAAEAAAMLFPEKILVGIQNLRAYRWITFEKGVQSLELEAKLVGPGAAQVVLREPPKEKSNNPIGLPVLEAVMQFANAYPDAVAVEEFSLQGRRRSMWQKEGLYSEGMFSGPSFRGVSSVEWWGEDGIEATLMTLPVESFFSSTQEPCFVLDPVLLDAAGQLIAYWIADHMTTGFNVYPFRMESLEIYGPHLSAGQKVAGRARILPLDKNQLRSTIELIGPDSKMHVRIVGWDDRSFDLPDTFYRVRFRPTETYLSERWHAFVDKGMDSPKAICRKMTDFPENLLHDHGGVWLLVLAYLTLDRQERQEWLRLTDKGNRKHEWLLARIAAKDCVREYMAEKHGRPLCMADISIHADSHGQPFASVKTIDENIAIPHISLAHTAKTGAAMLAFQAAQIGFDFEKNHSIAKEVKDIAFTAEEHNLIAETGDPNQWLLRLWCAKEAVGKAIGKGLRGGPLELVVQSIDQESGKLYLKASGTLADELAKKQSSPIEVFSVVDSNYTAAAFFIKE